MKAVLMPFSQVHRSTRGHEGGPLVADHGVLSDVRGITDADPVLPNRCFIFAMRRNRQRRLAENPFERRLVIDQQIAGTGPDEDLDSGCALGGSEAARDSPGSPR